MLRRVVLVRTDFLVERITSIIMVTKLSDLTTSTVTSNTTVTMIMGAICSSETLVLTRVTWHNTPEDGIFHSHRRENLKSDKGYHEITGSI
jgi:hypothetical protein